MVVVIRLKIIISQVNVHPKTCVQTKANVNLLKTQTP